MRIILLFLVMAGYIIFVGTFLLPLAQTRGKIISEAKSENISNNECQPLFDYDDKYWGRTIIYRCVKDEVICTVARTYYDVSMQCNEIK